MKVIPGMKELEILVHNFCMFFVDTFGATLSPQRNAHLVILFFRNHETNQALEMSLSYL